MRLSIYDNQVIEAINAMAFMIHESYMNKERWDNSKFVSKIACIPGGFHRLMMLCPITTVLGDVFEYDSKIGNKTINGIMVYKWTEEL